MRKFISRLLRLSPSLIGLALLVAIFLTANSDTNDDMVILNELINFDVTREPRIGSAQISTVTGDGSAITIDADTVSSKALISESQPISLDLDNPTGRVEFLAGGKVWFSGDVGEVDEIGESIRLEGSVELRTSNGYTATMNFLHSNLESTYIKGEGDVDGYGPLGTISSNKVEVFPDAFEEGSYFLKFSGDVFVVYLPEDKLYSLYRFCLKSL